MKKVIAITFIAAIAIVGCTSDNEKCADWLQASAYRHATDDATKANIMSDWGRRVAEAECEASGNPTP